MKTINIVYLFMMPYSPSIHDEKKGVLISPKGAPYFYDNDIQVKVLEEKYISVNETQVVIKPSILDEEIWVAQCEYEISAAKSDDCILANSTMQNELKKIFVSGLDENQKKIFEEFTIITVQQKEETPDEFVEKNKKVLSELIRESFDKPLDAHEIKKIISTRVRYSPQDMVVVDWNGAIIVTDDGDFQSDIDLLKIGNYQLMRYRILDSILEDKFDELKDIISTKGKKLVTRRLRLLQESINQRLAYVLNFEKLDQSLLLIGDWYSSQLYEAVVSEFYINQWQTVVKKKLESLGALHDVVKENYTFSWIRVIEFITFIGWFVMMIGYFVLLYIDFKQI